MTKKKDPTRVKAEKKKSTVFRGKQKIPTIPRKWKKALVDLHGNLKTAADAESRRVAQNFSWNKRFLEKKAQECAIESHMSLFREQNIIVPVVSESEMTIYLRDQANLIVTPSITMHEGRLPAMYAQAVTLRASIPRSRGKRFYVQEFTQLLKYQLMKIDQGEAWQKVEKMFKLSFQEPFRAVKLVELQDNHQSNSISMEAIESIGSLSRKNFFNDDGSEKTHIRGIIPCRSSVQKAAKAIAFTMERRLMFENMAAVVLDSGGQCVILNLSGIMSTIIADCNYIDAGYGYSETSRLSDGIGPPKKVIQWAFSVDGGKLTNQRGFLVACLKIVDVLALCRMLGLDIDKLQAGQSVVPGMHSSRFEVFVAFLVGIDNFCNNAKLVGACYNTMDLYCGENGFWDPTVNYRFFGSNCMVADKKEQHVLSCTGGGSAICWFFCCYCCQTNEKRGQPSLVRCKDCLRLDPDHEFDCYHTVFLTSSEVARLKALAAPYDTEGIPQEDSNADNVYHRCVLRRLSSKHTAQEAKDYCVKLFLLTAPVAAKTSGAKCYEIVKEWFKSYAIPSNSVATASVFVIKQHLRARGFFLNGTLTERSPIFSDLLVEVGKYFIDFPALDSIMDDWWRCIIRFVFVMGDIFEYLENGDAKELRILNKMETAMICGLHFELRVGQKLIRCLLDECRRYLTIQGFKDRMVECDRIFNEVFTGGDFASEELAVGDAMAGDFRTNVEQGSPVDFKTSMVKQRKVFAHIDKLCDTVFKDLPDSEELEDRKEQWKRLLKCHEEVMIWIREPLDFTPTMIDTFQLKADEFGRFFRALLGVLAETNYVHDLTSAHFRPFLERYGNVFRFSGIGFESYIGVVRSYALRRTQRGGHKGGKNERQKTTIAMAMADKGLRDNALISAAMQADGDKLLESAIFEDGAVVGKVGLAETTRVGPPKKRGRPFQIREPTARAGLDDAAVDQIEDSDDEIAHLTDEILQASVPVDEYEIIASTDDASPNILRNAAFIAAIATYREFELLPASVPADEYRHIGDTDEPMPFLERNASFIGTLSGPLSMPKAAETTCPPADYDDPDEVSDADYTTWASLVLQSAMPEDEIARNVPVDDWTEPYEGTIIQSDDEGDSHAYSRDQVLAFEGSFGNEKSNEERWSVGNIDHLSAHRSTTSRGCSLLAAVKKASSGYPTKEPVIVSSTFTFSAQSLEFDDDLKVTDACLESPEISDMSAYPFFGESTVDTSAVVDLPEPRLLLSTPLRRSTRAQLTVPNYQSQSLEIRYNLVQRNDYSLLGGKMSLYRLPNELRDVSHQHNTWNCFQCCPGTCDIWQNCDQHNFGNDVDPVIKFDIIEKDGLGSILVTRQRVTADDYIGEYTGVAISEPEAERRRQEYEADKSIGFYIMSLGDNNLSGLCLYIDARGFDSPLAMINHSCSPNCRAEIWTVEGIPRVGLFANIDIASDSELSFDYRSKATGLEDGELCKCGSANCRGFF